MADTADHRQRAAGQPPGQPLVVEGVQILEGSPTAHQQQHIAFQPGLRGLNGGQQFGRRLLPLHAGRVDDDTQLRGAPAQCGEHVLKRCGLQRADDADGVDMGRQQLLASGVEQPFGRQQRLQPRKALPDIARPGQLHALDAQLEVATRLVERDAGHHFDTIALARHEAHPLCGHAEHDGAHGSPGFLQREVPVAAGRPREVGQLAHHHHGAERVLQQTTSHPVELADCQCLLARKRLRRGCKSAFLLFHRYFYPHKSQRFL